MVRWETAKGRLCNTIDAHNNSRVFNRAARIQQPCADCADFRPLDVLSHDREPVRLDHFDTVVKKKKPRAVGLLDRLIFRCGIVGRV